MGREVPPYCDVGPYETEKEREELLFRQYASRSQRCGGQFFEDLNENGITIKEIDKTLTIYHLFGAHGLAKMNENMERINPDTDSIEDRYSEIRGVYKGIYMFLEELKEKDIYDSSTIIITADHGSQDYFSAATILVKEPNIHNDEMIINHAPITFVNLHSSIRKAALETSNNIEPTLTEIPEDLIIERKHSCTNKNNLHLQYPDEPIFEKTEACQVTFHGDAFDLNNVTYSWDSCWPNPAE